MPFCANCGSEVQGKFCAKCGTPIAGPAPAGPSQYTPPPAYTPPPYTPPPPGPTSYAPPGGGSYTPPADPYAPQGVAQAGLEENMACALCYLLLILTGVLFLVLEPYNKNRNIRFHAFQSIFVWLAMVVAGIVFGIAASIITLIPFIGWTVSLLLWPLYGLATLALWLALMYKAYNKERWVLPVIGPLAEKQA